MKKEVIVVKANKLVASKPRVEVYNSETAKKAGDVLTKTNTALETKLMNAAIHKMQTQNIGLSAENFKQRAIEKVQSLGISLVSNKDLYEVAVEEEFRVLLRNEVKKVYRFDTAEILELCGVGEENFKYAMKKLKDFQSANIAQIVEYVPNSTYDGIEAKISSINPIPRITFYVEDKSIEVELQSYAVPYLFALASGFTKINILETQNLKSSYSIKLYELAIMLFKIQHTKSYRIDELQAIFGTKYKTAVEFRRNVLNKAIEEVNEKTDLEVSLVKSHHNFQFKIKRKINLTEGEKDLNSKDLSHFLACEQFFKNMGRVNAIKDFEKYKAGILKILEEKKEEELEIEYKIAKPHFAAIPKIQKILKENQTNYTYDEKYMVVRTAEVAQNDYGFVRLGDNPIECLRELEKSFMQQTPSPLPSPIYEQKEEAILVEKNTPIIKKTNWLEELIESKQAKDPSKILSEIVEMGSFLYFDSEQMRHIIDRTNINIFMHEMANRINNSRDYERFFSFPSPAQKLLFVKISNE